LGYQGMSCHDFRKDRQIADVLGNITELSAMVRSVNGQGVQKYFKHFSPHEERHLFCLRWTLHN